MALCVDEAETEAIERWNEMESLVLGFLICFFVNGVFVSGNGMAVVLDETNTTTMATRIAARYITRRLSTGGKVLNEEEKAAENVYIKKMEQEKLAKAARKGPRPEEKPATATDGSGGTVTDAKPTGSDSTASKVSTDKYRNYAVVAGVITAAAGLGWYLTSTPKKTEVAQD
ncbi:hypothetical protein AKJ16_DCAP23041 [Drosera capensis]